MGGGERDGGGRERKEGLYEVRKRNNMENAIEEKKERQEEEKEEETVRQAMCVCSQWTH